MIDKNINKQKLREISRVSSTSIAKLGKCGNTNTDVLLRICNALDSAVADIMEFVRDDGLDTSGDVLTDTTTM